MDNDVKLALAQRLDTVMVERGEALDELRFRTDELEEERRQRASLEARLTSAVGAMGSPEPSKGSGNKKAGGPAGAGSTGAGANGRRGGSGSGVAKGGGKTRSTGVKPRGKVPSGSARSAPVATTPDAGGPGAGRKSKPAQPKKTGFLGFF